jgi:two-component system alkaline phosphatase synthesis response regulator PhoP
MTRILVVEDDRDIANLIARYVEKAGWQPEVFTSGSDALAAARKRVPDCVVLDLMLPGMDGLEVCRALRSDPATALVPIIMVTARGEETDLVVGLEIGADDYVPKPFSPRELAARIKAVLRRVEDRLERNVLALEDVLVNRERREVSVAGRPVTLRVKEFDLLAYLLEHPGIVFTREQLLERVWGMEYAAGTRTVDMHVVRLRRQLERPHLIETIRGIGYRAAPR